MTLQRLRELLSNTAVKPDHFYNLDRLTRLIDECIADAGSDALAPEAIWDDDGMVAIVEADSVRLIFGGRIDSGWWVRMPPRPAPRPEPEAPCEAEPASVG